MKKPLVSIIVPVFNTEAFLSDCVSSILAQDYENFELILVDNDSSDNSASICKEYTKEDQRVKFISSKQRGAGQARNRGLDVAAGVFIVFVDSDDIITDDYLSYLIKKSETDKCDLVCAEYIAFDGRFSPKDSKEKCDYFNLKEATSNLLTQRISAGPVCKLYKASLLKDLRFKNYSVGEDLFFNYQYLQSCKKVFASNHIIYGYRRNPNSLTNKRFNARRMDGLAVTKAMLDSENYSEPAIIRHFMEAYFIIETIDSAHESKDYPKEMEQCKNILKKYRKTVLFSKVSTKKQRTVALLSFLSPILPAKIINFLRH